MQVLVEIDESQYGLLCKRDEVAPLMKELSALYGAIWTEAKYDPYNEDTRTFAARLLPMIQAANKILRFKQ